MKKTLFIGSLLLLSWADAAQGETSTRAVTLEDAVRLALENNEVPRIAEARLRRAHALRREAYAALFPSLTLTGVYTRRSREVTREFDGQSAVFQSNDALRGEATLDATIFDGSRFPLIEKAEEEVEAQTLESKNLTRGLVFDVAESFFASLTAEWTLRAANRRVDLAKVTVENVRARWTAGLTSRNDLTRSQLELASARIAVTRSKNAVELTRLLLGFLTGEEMTEPDLADPNPLAFFDDQPGSNKELVPEAIRSRPDLAALRKRAEAMRHFAFEPWMRLVPSLDLLGTVRGTNETGFSGETFNWDVAVALRWILFDGGTRYAQAEARAAEARELELQADRLKREIALDVRSAIADLRTAESSVAQATHRLDIARANTREVRARFGSGLASALEQADASVSEFEAEVEVHKEVFQARLARLHLLEALGRDLF